MSKEEILELQTKMKEMGFYNGSIDGLWGPKSEAAYKEYSISNEGNINLSIAWSAKVSKEFVERVVAMCERLKMDSNGANYMMACMAWETGETFSPKILNGAGSGSTGLIQFMPKTAIGLGTTVEELAKMSAEDQLVYVEKHFKPFKGKLKTLADVYSTIIYPKAVGKPDDYVLFSGGTIAYRQNMGIDINKDGKCTKEEAAAKVMQKYNKGMLPQNRRVI